MFYVSSVEEAKPDNRETSLESRGPMEDGEKTQGLTLRQRMIALLSEEDLSARELSKILGIREKVVLEHLPHIAKSMSSREKQLIVLPFQCLSCGFTFKERRRFPPPSRCPHCKKGHIERPHYRIL